MATEITLSNEQQYFIDKALEGDNILVDACIGSGKTTAIQYLCDKIPQDKNVLYLTYNRLLKIDAKSKIHNSNVTVTNYHGFAYNILKKQRLNAGVNDMIKKFNDSKPSIPKYDILIIDEYQDIELELAIMLEYIKGKNKDMQIVAVGDMAQKIYDKTNINVIEFINNFLGKHTKMNFTNCFRLSKDLAGKLGRIWNKEIKGVNDKCEVTRMTIDEVCKYLGEQEPKDILCLGSRTGIMTEVLNELEKEKSEKFNKSTVYASIRDSDSNIKTDPKKDVAIFTTYDSSKGLERDICVVFDYTESYWGVRAKKPMQKYEILRNIFCVAASRGKRKIIFVYNEDEELSEETLSQNYETNYEFGNVAISSMFDFKYKEDIEKCYDFLKITEVKNDDNSIIQIKSSDELIDLSPCIGIYQEACYFIDKNIDKEINLLFEINKDLYPFKRNDELKTIDEKILYLTSLETRQQRYINQVDMPFVSEEDSEKIINRLSKYFSKDEKVQVDCRIGFKESIFSKVIFEAIGFADVVKKRTVYELKFVNELSHEHFLQCACYMIALGLRKGIILNTRNNQMFIIKIRRRRKFMNAVVNAITKGKIKRFY